MTDICMLHDSHHNVLFVSLPLWSVNGIERKCWIFCLHCTVNCCRLFTSDSFKKCVISPS
uniref:Uncharacterized protein n=2 Tax=Anguilla anguilla TaxID=7936 RepID=A0A0E9TY28_ANGAN